MFDHYWGEYRRWVRVVCLRLCVCVSVCLYVCYSVRCVYAAYLFDSVMIYFLCPVLCVVYVLCVCVCVVCVLSAHVQRPFACVDMKYEDFYQDQVRRIRVYVCRSCEYVLG